MLKVAKNGTSTLFFHWVFSKNNPWLPILIQNSSFCFLKDVPRIDHLDIWYCLALNNCSLFIYARIMKYSWKKTQRKNTFPGISDEFKILKTLQWYILTWARL